MKYCKKCGELKDRSEFNRNCKAKDGLRTDCRSCQRGYNKQYHEDNRDRNLERMAQWKQDNRDNYLAYARSYSKQWRADNPDYLSQWLLEHPEYQRLSDGRARARANNSPAEVFSWSELEAYWHSIGLDPSKDYITGEPLQDDWHLDHVVSLSDPNSPGHVLSNVRPCNASTNIAKGNQALADYQKELTHV